MADRHKRTLSFTEIETALTCFARWDFAYGGRLAGSTLKPRELATSLSEGRAWGVAVAAWHQNSAGVLGSWYAHEALREELNRQVLELTEAELPAPSAEAQLDLHEHLSGMLDHYAATATPLPGLRSLEGELTHPIPSRGASGRASPLYSFLCRVDGEVSYSGRDLPSGEYVVEFKLRDGLTDPALILRQRQHRWYAWTRSQQKGRPFTGVIVDERLNAHPRPATIVKGNRKGTFRPSHDKRQMITPETYLDVCTDFAIEPDVLTLEALRGRMWQQRIPIILRPDELDAAGVELRDAAKLIRDLDSGELAPIRNASFHCRWCKFAAVCSDPTDGLYVDSLFTRSVPKRERLTERTSP